MTPKVLDNVWVRGALLILGLAVLALVYFFQRINVPVSLVHFGPNVNFIINRTVRLILNDLACFIIIFALFRKPKYLKLAFWLFLAELFVVLPCYFALKLSLEGASEISSPLLSQVHRLIVNPILMFLLIAGFVYQNLSHKRAGYR